jgi:hypothetical protein
MVLIYKGRTIYQNTASQFWYRGLGYVFTYGRSGMFEATRDLSCIVEFPRHLVLAGLYRSAIPLDTNTGHNMDFIGPFMPLKTLVVYVRVLIP